MLDTTGPEPTDLAYLAGYMDGEGCFRANKGSIEVQVKNTYPHVLYLMQKLFGGAVSVESRSRLVANHRTAFCFAIYGDSARSMVNLLLPYLKEKKAQAEIVLQLIDHPKHSAIKVHLTRRLKELKRIDYGG